MREPYSGPHGLVKTIAQPGAKRGFMKRIAILFGLLIALPACNEDAPAPMAQQTQRQTAEQAPPQPPPPPSWDFPVEENALSTVQAFTAMPTGVSFVIATADAVRMWELLGGEAPDVPPYTPDRAPELLDTHPERLTAIGIDPTRPIGIAMYGEVKKPLEGDKWVIFGTLKDRDKFKEAFALNEREGKLFTSHDQDRRHFVQFDNGEFIIASKVEPQLGEDRGKVLGDSPLFMDFIESLEYGKLGTAFMQTKRGTGIYGVGVDENGLGVKAISDDDIFAARLRMNFAHYVADLYPQVPYLNRAINIRAELHTTGRNMAQQIDEIEQAPRGRRSRAAKEVMADFEVIGELEARGDGRVSVGRVWKVEPADIARAYRGWVKLGHTEDEISRQTQLTSALASIEIQSQMDVEERTDEMLRESRKFMGKKDGFEKATGMGGPMVNAMMKLGGVMDPSLGQEGKGSKGKGKGKEKEIGGPMGGIMKGLGSFGGVLGGGSEGGSDVTVHSRVPELRRHMQKRRQQLAICWGRSGHEESFDVRLDIESDVEGKITLHSLRGAPNNKIKDCVRKAVGNRGPIPKADPEKPDAGIESLRGVVRLKFTL